MSDPELEPQDPLQFQDTRTYKDRIKAQQEKTGRDAMVISQGAVNGARSRCVCSIFGFMGGSMGSVVGEKICRAVDRALEGRRLPLILVTASGGARMQEEFSRSCKMAKLLRRWRSSVKRSPVHFDSADPTFGGVTASIAMLGMSSLPSRKR